MNADYLIDLNEAQKAAVLQTDGPLLILAGAGTGKTKVLTSRLAHIIYTKKSFPSNILAVTFTNKAAKEMQIRIGKIIGNAIEGMNWLGTFHSIGAKLLRAHAEQVNLKSDFTILDTDDQLKVIKEVIKAAGIDDKHFPPRFFLSFIEGWKNKGLTPEKILNHPIDAIGHEKSVTIYKNYQQRLTKLNCVDFGDLLLLPLKILQNNVDLLNRYQSLFSYILVDEYQDTNTVQYLLLRLLSQRNRNIACVGDDDQSIYGWRGADVNNILNFEKDFEGAKIIRLETNYRSTKNILGAARSLISFNKDRLGKDLSAHSIDSGNKVKIRSLWSAEDEARYISDEIASLKINKINLNEIAILVRASFQMREFEDRFIINNIPYRVIGGPRFYERQEIRDVIAYLQLVINPDNDLKFERIINTPRRGIGETTLRLLIETSRTLGLSLYQVSKKLVQTDEIKPNTRVQLSKLITMIDGWIEKNGNMDHVNLTQIILEESGYIAMWENDKSPTSETRIENIKELIGQISEFNSLNEFLEHISLVLEIENDETIDKVNIMTLHSAKGLEFDVVFIPGLEEGVFPNQRALDEKGNIGLEEERRLAHVGLTRAKNNLQLLHAQNRRIYGSWTQSIPSRFLDEISKEFVEQDIVYTNNNINNSFNDSYNRPNLKKLTALQRLQAAGHIIDGDYEEITSDEFEIIEQNQRVFHTKFGYGFVVSNDHDRVEVDFEKAGKKIVLSSYLELVKNG
ncbi:MAG: UvrD-helicase domain-containing protein [Hyphomicrobiales bacterium]|nr:UvrD-helicase domain-containing protein [Hyphomicrobiales bacterium]